MTSAELITPRLTLRVDTKWNDLLRHTGHVKETPQFPEVSLTYYPGGTGSIEETQP